MNDYLKYLLYKSKIEADNTQVEIEVLTHWDAEMKENSKKMERLPQRIINWNGYYEYLIQPFLPSKESNLKAVCEVVAFRRISWWKGDCWHAYGNRWVYWEHILQEERSAQQEPEQLELFSKMKG